MARPTGSRNANYEERRAELALAASRALINEAGEAASLAELARAAGVSVPTLKHYFEDHNGVFAAALAASREAGKAHVEGMREPGPLALSDSMRQVAEQLQLGWRLGVGQIFAGAFTHGLGHEVRGPAAVDHVLEPTLQALEARLAVHQGRGELAPDADLRVAGLAFLSPLLLALLHQNELSGRRCRPLSMPDFSEAHLQGWLRGWGASG